MNDEEFLSRGLAASARRRRSVRSEAPVSEREPSETEDAERPATVETPNAEEFDLSTLPSIDSIDSGDRRHGVPAQGRSAGVEPCGASSRLDRRSRDPRLRRPCGERLGLQRSRMRCPASVRSIIRRSRCAIWSPDRRGRAARDRRHRGPRSPNGSRIGSNRARGRDRRSSCRRSVDVPHTGRTNRCRAETDEGRTVRKFPHDGPETEPPERRERARVTALVARRTHGGALPR